MAASTSIVCAFRVFDANTTLRSDAARAFGTTWFDLILHKLNDGVRVDITITDFDPVITTDEHRRSWKSARMLAALNELSIGARLQFKIATHPARIGLLPKLLLHPKTSHERASKEADALTPGLAEAKETALVPLVPATHHQKLAVIDDRRLYIGGLDLDDRRYDTRDHDRPAECTWHDVQALVQGPIVQSAKRHLTAFVSICAGEQAPTPPEPGFLRTLSKAHRLPLTRLSPKTIVCEIEAAHLAAAGRATGLIYLESQFFRHRPFAEALAEAAQRQPELACMLVLPAAPEDVAFEGNRREDAQLGAERQAEALEVLKGGLGRRLAVVTPARPTAARPDPTGEEMATLHAAPIIYVHSKMSLFGPSEAIVSSANLNGRSMRWDTEAGIHLVRPAFVSRIWQRALGHWFQDLAPDPAGDPLEFVDWVNAAAAQNMVTAPDQRAHFLLPFPQWRDAELGSDLPGVPDEMV